MISRYHRQVIDTWNWGTGVKWTHLCYLRSLFSVVRWRWPTCHLLWLLWQRQHLLSHTGVLPLCLSWGGRPAGQDSGRPKGQLQWACPAQGYSLGEPHQHPQPLRLSDLARGEVEQPHSSGALYKWWGFSFFVPLFKSNLMTQSFLWVQTIAYWCVSR